MKSFIKYTCPTKQERNRKSVGLTAVKPSHSSPAVWWLERGLAVKRPFVQTTGVFFFIEFYITKVSLTQTGIELCNESDPELTDSSDCER